MIKLLLTLIFIGICSTAHATTWYLCTTPAGGWSNTSSWTSVSADQGTCAASLGSPSAGDTAILNSSSGSVALDSATADVATTVTMTGYTGTLTLTTGDSLIVSGGTVTLGGTITGTGTLKTTGSETIASGGITWTGAFNMASTSGTVTLSGGNNFTVTGICTNSASDNLNETTSEELVCNGGLQMSSSMSSGTATIVLGGGTWQSSGVVNNPMILAGNVTLNSGPISFAGSSFTYSSGTITTTGNSFSLNYSGSAPTVTLNTAGMSFNQIIFNGALSTAGVLTVTLSSALTASAMAIDNENVTFVGSYNISIANLIMASGNEGNNLTNLTLTLVASTTLNITNSMTISGIYANFDGYSGTENPILIKSSVGSTKVNINYTGTVENESILLADFTDIAATGNTIYDYGVFPSGSMATLTRTSNIITISNNNIGGVVLE